MHRSRLLLVAAAIVGLGALFLPFVTFDQQGTVNGFDGYAWPAAAVLAIPAVVALVGDRAESLRTAIAVVTIALCSLAVVLGAFKLADAASAADLETASLGAGPWILMAACVGGLAGAVSSLSRRI